MQPWQPAATATRLDVGQPREVSGDIFCGLLQAGERGRYGPAMGILDPQLVVRWVGASLKSSIWMLETGRSNNFDGGSVSGGEQRVCTDVAVRRQFVGSSLAVRRHLCWQRRRPGLVSHVDGGARGCRLCATFPPCSDAHLSVQLILMIISVVVRRPQDPDFVACARFLLQHPPQGVEVGGGNFGPISTSGSLSR